MPTDDTQSTLPESESRYAILFSRSIHTVSADATEFVRSDTGLGQSSACVLTWFLSFFASASIFTGLALGAAYQLSLLTRSICLAPAMNASASTTVAPLIGFSSTAMPDSVLDLRSMFVYGALTFFSLWLAAMQIVLAYPKILFRMAKTKSDLSVLGRFLGLMSLRSLKHMFTYAAIASVSDEGPIWILFASDFLLTAAAELTVSTHAKCQCGKRLALIRGERQFRDEASQLSSPSAESLAFNCWRKVTVVEFASVLATKGKQSYSYVHEQSVEIEELRTRHHQHYEFSVVAFAVILLGACCVFSRVLAEKSCDSNFIDSGYDLIQSVFLALVFLPHQVRDLSASFRVSRKMHILALLFRSASFAANILIAAVTPLWATAAGAVWAITLSLQAPVGKYSLRKSSGIVNANTDEKLDDNRNHSRLVIWRDGNYGTAQTASPVSESTGLM